MDSFTLNKIAGAVLGTCLVGMGIGIVGESIFFPEAPKKPGFALPEGKEGAGGGEQKPAGTPLAVLLSKADPKKGEADAKICSACHNFQEGAGAKVGPDLYGVVDRPKGSAAGFDYSPGMKAKGGNWTFADLNEFITKPSAYVQGTKMGFAGESSPEKRADILAYLRTLAKTPAPLPQVTDADKKAAAGGGGQEAAAGSKPEGGQAPAAGGGDFVKLVAAADPKKGQAAAQICSACHNFKKGAGTLVGPELYGVVDRPKGSEPGFDYSAGMKAKGGKWTYDDLNQFLTKPSAFVQGTKMGFAGEANEKKRAEIVAFLRTLADNPAPLPGAGGGDAKPEPAKADAPKPDASKPDAAPAPAPAKPDAPKADAPKPDAPKPDAAPAPAPAQPAKPDAAPAPDKPETHGAADQGPEPYAAADPQYPTEQAEPVALKAEPSPPSFTDAADEKASPDAPVPYSAPTPDEAAK